MSFTHLLSFTGRADRAQFWAVNLTGLLAVLIVYLIAGVREMQDFPQFLVDLFLKIIVVFYVWASLAVQVKRWHDRDKSGWYALISLIPWLGWLWVFVECACLTGTVGPNSYGADPLSGASAYRVTEESHDTQGDTKI